MTDPLPALRARLDALDDAPVGRHPDVLEDVHRALVAQLDELAADAARGAPRPSAPPAPSR